MKRGSERISVGAEALVAYQEEQGLPPAFDVLIVGSGYGGAIAARRLADFTGEGASPRLRVGLLERGLEYQPGDFPTTLSELTAHVRLSGGNRTGVAGWRDGLFDFRTGNDVNVLVANGLGGGSLINAGVAEEADKATREDPAWPVPWRGNHARWAQLYKRAAGSLGAVQWSESEDRKARAMADLARQIGKGATMRKVSLTIEPPSHAKPAEAADGTCHRCGNCFSGCNVGAKKTLGQTQLEAASASGVQIYTGATVLRIARAEGTHPWEVQWTFTDGGKLGGHARTHVIRARRVILAAGALGSTEILMRSRGPGLRFSDQLGAHFSTNGDVIGAQCGIAQPTGTIGHTAPSDTHGVGPTITHLIEVDRDDAAHPGRRVVLQDLCVPGPLSWLFEELITSLMLAQRWTRFNWRTSRPDTPDHAVIDPRLTARTLLIAALGHDGAAGQLRLLPGFDNALHDGNLQVHWPKAGEQGCFTHIDQLLAKATRRSNGAYWVPSPLWQGAPSSPLLDEGPPPERH